MGTIKALGISYPIVKGNTGFFEQTFDTLSNVRSKLYILLKTDPAERVFMIYTDADSRGNDVHSRAKKRVLPSIAG